MERHHRNNPLENHNHEPMTSHLNLNKLSQQVMNTWEERVRGNVDSAGDLLRATLVDALPKFLSLLAEALSEPSARGLIAESTALVRQHAADRARQTQFGPSQIIQEFQILKEATILHLEEVMSLSPQDYSTIQQTFDETIQQALMEFFQTHASFKEEFTATLSHDLRTPIGVASMSAELIKEMAQDLENSASKDDIIGLADRIAINMKRADRMIQDMLDASILRFGEKLPVNISNFDLLGLAREVVGDIEERESNRIFIEGLPTPGKWDREGLKRSLENLLKNAIKYGAPKAPITLRIERHNDRVQLLVHNEGNPISQKDQELIFRNFGRSKTSASSGSRGWGIGLALVRAMTESMGGSVYLDSSPENGTTFIMDLPLDASKTRNESNHQH